MGGKTEIEEKVIDYVYKHYPSYYSKPLIIKEYKNHFSILKHPDGGPLVLSKAIIQ
tara:strand:+ start:4841 stop:5008 length:168 start_codon:yes stop_codon:yes gene_type:complete